MLESRRTAGWRLLLLLATTRSRLPLSVSTFSTCPMLIALWACVAGPVGGSVACGGASLRRRHCASPLLLPPIPTSTTSTGTGTDQLCAHYATLLYGQVWRATTISEQFVMRFESCCAIRLTFASAAGRIFYLLRTYRLLRFQGAKIQNKE